MKGSQLVPVVLCGGAGTRLWPLSRAIHPKQLLPLVDEKSMLQNTLLRVRGLLDPDNHVVICNHEYRFMVAEQLREIGVEHAHIFLEPEGRNTAPAVTMIALHCTRQQQDPVLLVMPADHVITDEEKLIASIQAGQKLAEEGSFIVFGVTPTKPETGYGYIHRGTAIPQSVGFNVKTFVEKPNLEKAQQYIAEGDYLWNSGIFMFKASLYLEAMKEFAEDIYIDCKEAYSGMNVDLDFYRFNEKFLRVRSESIDFALMEKVKNIVMVPLESKWSDVGSWSMLWEMGNKDENGNVIRGEVFVEGVKNSYLRAEKRLLAVVGLSDVAVIETQDAVLVTYKDQCQKIKSIVTQLQLKQRDEANSHHRVYRPWGYYETLNKCAHYQVKYIVIHPGAKLSLQLHQHRSESWVIIKGTAQVTRGDKRFELTENQSIYIPAKIKHRIENEGTGTLELIEVQTGDYLGEDDIVRFEDIYDRLEMIA